ncbi:V-type proton ATPase subunit [Erysiphe necator]|nr:V-type proton ATPase subunit [Erysiphe necator]
MANGWSILIGLVIVVFACVAGWVLPPKNETQAVWRSSLILSFASCFIMWAITFLAQWHPLIVPRRGGLRELAVHE